MIGPSAPNGPPVPIATAAESGLRNMIFGEMRLRLYSTRSITSGIPCPRMAAAPYRAMMPTMNAPAIGTSTDHGPQRAVLGAMNSPDRRPKYAMLVMNPIRCVRMFAMTAPAPPTTIAIPEITMTRRSTAVYSAGAWTAASDGSSDGATGIPCAGSCGDGSPSGTRRLYLCLLLAEHGRSGNVDFRFAQPTLEQIGQRCLVIRLEPLQRIHELRLN